MPNVSTNVMRGALEKARQARLFFLERMATALAAPRPDLSPNAPRIHTMQIPVDKIRELIGPGGKMIRSIVDETGVKIDVEDDGTVKIFSSTGTAAQAAIQRITDICAVAEIGKIYLGKVVRIVDFGAFVEIFPGTDGLLHISEIAESRVKLVTDELKEGDQIQVKVLALEGNKIKLSRKAGAEGVAREDERWRGEDGIALDIDRRMLARHRPRGGPFSMASPVTTARLRYTEAHDQPAPSQHPSKPRRYPKPVLTCPAAEATKG